MYDTKSVFTTAMIVATFAASTNSRAQDSGANPPVARATALATLEYAANGPMSQVILGNDGSISFLTKDLSVQNVAAKIGDAQLQNIKDLLANLTLNASSTKDLTADPIPGQQGFCVPAIGLPTWTLTVQVANGQHPVVFDNTYCNPSFNYDHAIDRQSVKYTKIVRLYEMLRGINSFGFATP